MHFQQQIFFTLVKYDIFSFRKIISKSPKRSTNLHEFSLDSISVDTISFKKKKYSSFHDRKTNQFHTIYRRVRQGENFHFHVSTNEGGFVRG